MRWSGRGGGGESEELGEVEKITQNKKIAIYLPCDIFQEQYNISLFLVHLNKMMIFPGFFLIFSKL